MGNGCNADAAIHTGNDLKYFQEKYGKTQLLNMLRQNIRKDQIVAKIPQISQRYRKVIHNFKIDSIRELNFLESNLFDQMETKIKNIEKNDTGEVSKAEKAYGMCAEDIMGRRQIEERCSKLRKQIHSVYESEQKNTKETIQKSFQTYVQNLQKQTNQKFGQIGQLPQENRQLIKKQAKKEFKKEIKSYRQQVHHDIEEGKVCDLMHIKQDYNHLHPKQEIQKIKRIAQQLIAEGEKKIIGTDIFGINSKQMVLTPELSPGFWGCCGRA